MQISLSTSIIITSATLLYSVFHAFRRCPFGALLRYRPRTADASTSTSTTPQDLVLYTTGREGTFEANTNVSDPPQDIIGFVFDNEVIRSFKSLVSVVVTAETNEYALYEIMGIQKESDWTISVNLLTEANNDPDAPDPVGIDFYMTSDGQMQYTSILHPGHIRTLIKYRHYMTTTV